MKTIQEMAIDAGFYKNRKDDWYEAFPQDIEAFAALVRKEAIADEREACAMVCEAGVNYEHPTVKGHIMENFGHSRLLAKAIRARSNT